MVAVATGCSVEQRAQASSSLAIGVHSSSADAGRRSNPAVALNAGLVARRGPDTPRPQVPDLFGGADWWGHTVGSASPVAAYVDTQLRIEQFALKWVADALAGQWFAAVTSPPSARPSPRTAFAQGNSTGMCGGATNGADRFITRESGGNPSAVNQTSGAYGCYQIMPATWAGSCSDLGSPYGSSAAAQAQCASRLPAAAWGG
jgi:hypothetical protein